MKLEQTIALIRQRWPEVASSALEEPVFVLAAGWRSGSTLLQRMLLRQCLVWGEPYGSSGFIDRLVLPLGRFSEKWPETPGFIEHRRHLGPLSQQWTANLFPPVQCLLDAHISFFRKLLAEPSQALGYSRWGLKEVRYGMEHAIYLRWLFPKAKFLFLVRNPYDCWASYSRLKSSWQRFYPEPLITTPEQFGAHWCSIVESCADRFDAVGGFPIRYEHLVREDFNLKALADYLGFEPDPAARELWIGGAPAGVVGIDEMERLQQVVGSVAECLGYRQPLPRPR